jgi:hypothetical protein
MAPHQQEEELSFCDTTTSLSRNIGSEQFTRKWKMEKKEIFSCGQLMENCKVMQMMSDGGRNLSLLA